MKRYGLTIKDIADVLEKSYPPIHQKINQKRTSHGKVATFDIQEANKIERFVIQTEQNYLKERYGDNWVTEWEKRWGHIQDWFQYIFFDEVVTNVTSIANTEGGQA